MKEKNWTLMKVWNESLIQKMSEPRKTEPRNRMYASELGRSDIDIFLKLKGEEPSNNPDERAHRKFNAGDLTEWFVKLVLVKTGIYVATQTPVKITIDNCIEVSGKLDFIAGGKPDFNKGQNEIDELIRLLELPPLFSVISNNLIEYFKQKYPEGLQEKILEVKSLAVQGFNKIEKTGKPIAGHDLQAFHYAYGLQKEAAICYISRDDWRMYEIPIFPNDQKLLDKYTEKVKRVSKYYLDDIRPELEPLFLFEEETLRFSTNFNVQYSNFLTKLYGFEHPEEYKDLVSKRVSSWNRVLGRVAKKQKMTPKNLEALEDIKSEGFDLGEIIKTLEKNQPLIEIEDDELLED